MTEMDKAMDKAKAEAEEIIGMRTLEELEEIEELLDDSFEWLCKTLQALKVSHSIPPIAHDKLTDWLIKARMTVDFLQRHLFNLSDSELYDRGCVIMSSVGTVRNLIALQDLQNYPDADEFIERLYTTWNKLKPLMRALMGSC